VELASSSRQFPSSLLVQGVTIDTSRTLAGGFGVVYRGLYDGMAVAIKQPQVHIGVDASFTVRSFVPYMECLSLILYVEVYSGSRDMAANESSFHPPPHRRRRSCSSKRNDTMSYLAMG
jgi:hypothetical protein